MKNLIPLKKTLEFDTKIAEITSISLEHNYNIEDESVIGNFIISGEYKSHELSANKDPFNFTIPFNVELDSKINKDSINIEISDFEYNFSEHNLNIDIEYYFEGEIIDIQEQNKENDREVTPVSESQNIQELDNNILLEKEEKEELINDQIIDINDDIPLKDENVKMPEIAEDNTYVNYNIHIVKENETIDQISLLYGVSNNVLHEYNDDLKCEVGDKIIIPDMNNE